jgi:hypothetical protein
MAHESRGEQYFQEKLTALHLFRMIEHDKKMNGEGKDGFDGNQ